MKNYQLEIYEAGSADDVVANVESDAPFMAISKGDLINLVDSTAEASGKHILRVVGLEHMLWRTDGSLRHKLCVFTENLENTREARLS